MTVSPDFFYDPFQLTLWARTVQELTAHYTNTPIKKEKGTGIINFNLFL